MGGARLDDEPCRISHRLVGIPFAWPFWRILYAPLKAALVPFLNRNRNL